MIQRTSLQRLYLLLQRLSLEQKQEVAQWLDKTIAQEQEAIALLPIDIPARAHAAVTDSRHYQGKTYQLEKRRCGKSRCRCMVGEVSESGHGPYWYAYWKDAGKLRNRYVGKRPPWERSGQELN